MMVEMLTRLRLRIDDSDFRQPALYLTAGDRATAAEMEIASGELNIRSRGSVMHSYRLLDYSLGTLLQALRGDGYVVESVDESDLSHDALDLIPIRCSIADVPIVLETAHWFSDKELGAILKDAVKEHNPEYSIEDLPEEEEYLVLWLASISCWYALAAANAKQYKIGVEGVNISKGERVGHYMRLATELQGKYNARVRSSDFASIEQGELVRDSVALRRLGLGI